MKPRYFTETLLVRVPPGPVQVSAYVRVSVVEFSGAKGSSVPLVALVPLQLPDAEHEVALEADHVSFTASPGSASEGNEREILGSGTISRVALAEALPPRPVQLRVNVLTVGEAPPNFAVIVCEPLASFDPDQSPEAVQD
jgi:hypothetical protein